METQQELDRQRLRRALQEDVDGGVNIVDLLATIQKVARWYDETPSTICDETRALYQAFSQECKSQALRMCGKYGVTVERVNGQPYLGLREMSKDIERGILKISVDNCSHPLMDTDETVDLRVWHDLAHYEEQAGFGFNAEYRVCNRQRLHVVWYSENVDLRYAVAMGHVLFSDIVGQVASGMVNNRFPDQKVFTLDHAYGGSHDLSKR